MFKKRFIILYFLFVGSLSSATKEPILNFCSALKAPNVLLLDRFTRIKLQKHCAYAAFPLSPDKALQTKEGCYYQIPFSWAESINYPQLAQLGFIITSSRSAMCPPLSYKDFETLTLKGWGLIDETRWKTSQINKVKRLLKKNRGIPPSGSPFFISPEEKLQITVYAFSNLFIPLIQQRLPLKTTF